MNDEERLARRTAAVDEVQRLLVEHLLLEVEPHDLDPDAPLFGSGHGLDSIDAVEVAVALENRFGVRMHESRVESVPHLRTINTIVDLVLARQELA
ncbi:MAG: acyl carrier protein [Alphaproteobacteria bacterium]|nr:acyl carrier protein [Alphaproteobacteria bacterium]